MIDNTELDRRLSRATYTEADPSTLAALSSAARAEARSSLRHRLIAIGTGALLVIGAGVVAAPAAADVIRHFLAQTGLPIGSGTEIIPESEWVDLGAGDLHEYIDYVFPADLPIPPGLTRQNIVDRTYAISNAGDTVTQEVSLRRSIEAFAYCGWAVEYLDAVRAGDDGRTTTAADILLAAADWPALVATDGGGITDRLREVGVEAKAHTLAAGHAVFAAGECDILGFDSIGDTE